MKKRIILLICLCILLITIHVPFTYIKPNYHIVIEPVGYSLSKGFMGLKVQAVMNKLQIESKETKYNDQMILAVKEFQKDHHLKANGIVDLTTWLALGFTKDDWYELEYYISDCLVNENSSYEERIEAMITTAKSYLKTPFVDGASGRPLQGVDCSGLIMQVLYSVGIDPTPISPIRHAYPEYEYESYSLWTHKNIKHYPYENVLKGDLVFFCNKNGRVNHIGLYIGNQQIIEATRQYGVKITTIHSTDNIKCVGRVIEKKLS